MLSSFLSEIHCTKIMDFSPSGTFSFEEKTNKQTCAVAPPLSGNVNSNAKAVKPAEKEGTKYIDV